LILLLALHTSVLYLCAYFVTKLGVKKELIERLPPLKQKSLDKKEKTDISRLAEKEIPDALSAPGIFDLSVPVLMGIFCAALLDFIYLLVLECINAVGYLVEYAGTYTPEEILLMGASFLFILFKLILAYLIAIPTKNLALRMSDKGECKAEEPIEEN
jgi:hypothetical protein